MFNTLPCEIIEEIFEFGIENSEEIISHSRVCKQFYEILENSKLWKFVKLSSVSRLRVGFRWSQMVSNPMGQILDTMNVFIDRTKGAYVDSKGISLLSEIKEKVNMKEYSNWMKYCKRDKYFKKYLKFGHFLDKYLGEWPILLLGLISLICLDATISIGLMSQLDYEDRVLSRGMWWLPYCFLPFYILFYVGLALVSVLAFTLLLFYCRKFMINKSVSEKYDKHFGHATDNIIMYMFLILGLVVYFGILHGVSSIFLSWAGQELSTLHSTVNTILYFILTQCILVLLIYRCGKQPIHFESCFQLASLFICLLTKYIYCLFPLSIYLTIKAVKSLNLRTARGNIYLELLPLGACLCALMLTVKYYSFLTMLPLTIPFLLATIDFIKSPEKLLMQ